MSEQIWGQIILAVIGGLISVTTMTVSLITIRSRAQLKRENALLKASLEQERTKAQADLERTKAEAQVAIIKAQEQSQARVIAAEGEIRSIADQHALMSNLLKLLSDSARRDAEKDERTQKVLSQLLDASRESLEALRLNNQQFTVLQTDIGEVNRVITLVSQAVAGLPTQLDQRPMVDGLKELTQRIDLMIVGLPAAQQALVREFVTAIRNIKSEAVEELLKALQSPNPNPTEVKPT